MPAVWCFVLGTDDIAGGVCVCVCVGGGGMFISKGINFLEVELIDNSEIVVSKC